MTSHDARTERIALLLLGAIQFVNVLEFLIVMPLGPDFAKGLCIPESDLGYFGTAYAVAAAVAGVVGSFWLDRLERRRALAVCMVGLVVATGAAGLAVGFWSLFVVRALAGLFGGPATALTYALVADLVPEARRGKAMGSVLGANALAAVLGVPAGLELARLGGWRLPFFAVAALGAVATLGAALRLPRVARLSRPPGFALADEKILALFRRREVVLSYAMTSSIMLAGFLVLPNLSAYLQGNLGYPRRHLSWLYLAGGAASFVTMRMAGRFVDRFGAFRVGAASAALLVLALAVGFIRPVPALPVEVVFLAFVVPLALRNVAHHTIASRVPGAHERARFLSLQSTVQHVASGLGALIAARVLHDLPGGGLARMPEVAAISAGLTLLLPPLLWRLERRLARRAPG